MNVTRIEMRVLVSRPAIRVVVHTKGVYLRQAFVAFSAFKTGSRGKPTDCRLLNDYNREISSD
jgi:hypothetical protein